MRSAYRWVAALAVVLALGLGALTLLALLAGSVRSDEVGSPAPPGPSRSPSPSPSPPSSERPGDAMVVPVVGVTDGDTLRVRVDGTTERLRIIGIDAPELREDECLAQEAASMMQRLAQSTSVRIAADPTQADRDAFDRILRHVWLLDGRSVGIEMLTAGLATEYTYAAAYVGSDGYRQAESEARAAGRGIWGEGCDGWVPVEPSPAAAVDVPTEGCAVKGNINAEGERIYHVPGQRYYEDTRIDESAGERWFCSEEEAREAGWRRART